MKQRLTLGRPLAAVVAVGALVAATVAVSPLAQADPVVTGSSSSSGKAVVEAPDGKYVVQLAAAPVATYDGGVAGLEATSPEAGEKLDAASAATAAYVGYLEDQRTAVLTAAGVPADKVIYDYDYTFAGFGVGDLSYDEAVALAATDGVVAVTPNEILALDTTRSPTFLGLDGEDGLWSDLGGPEGVGGAGEDIVIGVVDGGFTPESGSFAPLDPDPATTVPEGWAGTCDPGDPDDLGGGPFGTEEPGDQPAEIACDGDTHNSKVIGARYYVEGFGVDAIAPQEFLSPRDVGGHGSHTGSTAGGNFGVPITVGDADLGEISGMAPRARVSVYKACWVTPTSPSGSCASLDTMSAIDQAAEDGVDVINYSISGSSTSALTPQSVSFLNAAAVGIYVAVSAGNAGLDGSVNHNVPWVTTVAASTQDRVFEVTVTLGNGDEYIGTGIATAVPETEAVYAGDIPADDYPGDPDDARFCPVDGLDEEQAEGKVVVCERGLGIARVAKSAEVARAGGVGMVLANDEASGSSTNTERHSVPTAHVTFADGQEIIDYVEGNPDATIELSAYDEVVGDEVRAPQMAAFSSRGPGGVASGDLLKPDITAPGVDVLASLAPYPNNFGETYGFNSGTSMSSPHIAGIGALMKDLQPTWSPMAIKSALMTSAYQQDNQGDPIMLGDDPATPFSYGAGHVDPQAAADTVAVYDSGVVEWIRFLCGAGQLPPSDPNCEAVGSIDPSDFNSASVAIGELAGSQTVTRTLSNTTDAPLTLTTTGDFEFDGVTAVVDPPVLDIPADDPDTPEVDEGSADFTVTFTVTDAAALEEYAFGSLTWTDEAGGSSDIRSSIAVKPVAVGGAEALLVGEGSTGDVTDMIVSGINGPIDVTLGGLEPATVDVETLTNPDPGFPDPPVERDDIYEIVFDVPANAHLVHFALYEEDYVSGTDLDMYLYAEGEDGELVFVDLSATGVAGESLLIDNPEPGTYHVFIHLFSLAGPEETEVEAIHHSWAVTDEDVDDFSVDPETFVGTIGGEQDVTFSWTDLTEPDNSGDQPSDNLARYLGKADYVEGGGDEQYARTVVRVDVAAAEPTPTPTTPSPTTPPPTSEPPTSSPPPTEPPTTDPTPTVTTTLPGTGGGDAGLFAGLGLGAVLVGGLFIALAARRLREEV